MSTINTASSSHNNILGNSVKNKVCVQQIDLQIDLQAVLTQQLDLQIGCADYIIYNSIHKMFGLKLICTLQTNLKLMCKFKCAMHTIMASAGGGGVNGFICTQSIHQCIHHIATYFYTVAI